MQICLFCFLKLHIKVLIAFQQFLKMLHISIQTSPDREEPKDSADFRGRYVTAYKVSAFVTQKTKPQPSNENKLYIHQ